MVVVGVLATLLLLTSLVVVVAQLGTAHVRCGLDKQVATVHTDVRLVGANTVKIDKTFSLGDCEHLTPAVLESLLEGLNDAVAPLQIDECDDGICVRSVKQPSPTPSPTAATAATATASLKPPASPSPGAAP